MKYIFIHGEFPIVMLGFRRGGGGEILALFQGRQKTNGSCRIWLETFHFCGGGSPHAVPMPKLFREENVLLSGNWEIHRLKMCLLLKMVVFHFYV